MFDRCFCGGEIPVESLPPVEYALKACPTCGVRWERRGALVSFLPPTVRL